MSDRDLAFLFAWMKLHGFRHSVSTSPDPIPFNLPTIPGWRVTQV